MLQGMTVFDSHTHLGSAVHSGRVRPVDDVLRDMDREGVDVSLVIPFPVVEDMRGTHDEIGDALRRYPDRLRGTACIPPFIPPQQYRDEAKRCREEYGFVALKLQPQYQAVNPLAARFDYVFESALENEMAMVCHTGSGIPFALPSLFMFPARRFPDLRIILAHCGGGGMLVAEAIVAASFCPNIYLETSTLMPNHVLEVLAHIPASRVMMGTDLSECMHTEIHKLLGLGLQEEDLRAILAGTALSLFGNSPETAGCSTRLPAASLRTGDGAGR
ncbi:MAG: amidohydrolase family protein [Bryobacterales bacterium]|nr:amidohydrolase family protein [Bryobacterales bacterium]